MLIISLVTHDCLIIILNTKLTSGKAKPFVPRGFRPASVSSWCNFLAESKSASLAREPSAANNTFLAEKKDHNSYDIIISVS